MNRRTFILGTVATILFPVTVTKAMGNQKMNRRLLGTVATILFPVTVTKGEWREILTPEQFNVLRKEGTERAFTSPLNKESREGTYVCAGCELELFTSEMKYESGTGWPSFFNVIEGRVETRTDYKLIYPRTEYHCARCDGHQGHLFNDGPEPTSKRYCNNGVALKFNPAL